MSYSQEDFLYNRKGPWPQPSPVHPWGESPAVIHLPLIENIDWWIFIGSRYMATLPFCIPFFIKGLLKPGLKEVSNDRFNWFFNKTMISKFLSNKFDDKDNTIFKDSLALSPDCDWFIVDLEAVRVVVPIKGVYVSGTKTLLKKIDNKYYVQSIYVDKTETLLTNKDGDAWELAKYFVLQGAALCSTLVTHPIQHFPNDCINAITKTALPKKHLLFQLLKPHLRFTLPLENAVLNYKSSLLQEKWWMVYAPYPGAPKGLRELLVEGYKGIKGNASYPPFTFPMGPSKFETEYGDYLRAYYQVFQDFVAKIIIDIKVDDIWVINWANYIKKHIPSFPGGDVIFEQDNLLHAVTSFLFTVTVGHSVDHNNYGVLNKREIPLRIRQAPPGKNIVLKNRKHLCSPVDLMKYYMADSLFFSPFTVTKLINSKYKFNSQKEQDVVRLFKKELIQLDKVLTEKDINYMQLDKIASSIQF